MKKTLLLSLAMSALVITGMSFGTSNVHAYGMAGCGLGSLIFKQNSKVLQVLAATTNGTYGNQTFAITTGTSNCTGSAANFENKQQEMFVAVNYKNLEQQMAAGKGDKLDALAALMGCDSEKFGEMTRKNYTKLFDADTTPSDLLQKVKNQSTSCSI